MKRTGLILLSCLALLLAVVSSKAETNQFPLMAWDYASDEDTLSKMHDCGINMIAFVRPEMLDLCQKYSLKAIVFDEGIAGTNWSKPFDGSLARRNLPALIKKVGQHPAVYGYHIKDEPPAKDFPELAKAVQAVKELAPGKWPYINLFPGGGESYDKYLEDFATTCAPTALSYDRYSIIGDNDFDAGFWANLEQAREVALRHHLPLWNIVLTSTHWYYRELTQADVRLQIWGSLAYGVSGISFYKFCSKELPILNAPDLGNFRNGPLDQFGEKTPTWDWLRNCNRQVQNIAPIYLKLHSDDVYHFGTLPKRSHGPTDKTLVKGLSAGEFVVGDFTHESGARYVMIVNKSLKSSCRCNPEFNHPPKALKYVSPITGEVKPYPAAYYWLAPGQGVLIQAGE